MKLPPDPRKRYRAFWRRRIKPPRSIGVASIFTANSVYRVLLYDYQASPLFGTWKHSFQRDKPQYGEWQYLLPEANFTGQIHHIIDVFLPKAGLFSLNKAVESPQHKERLEPRALFAVKIYPIHYPPLLTNPVQGVQKSFLASSVLLWQLLPCHQLLTIYEPG